LGVVACPGRECACSLALFSLQVGGARPTATRVLHYGCGLTLQKNSARRLAPLFCAATPRQSSLCALRLVRPRSSFLCLRSMPQPNTPDPAASGQVLNFGTGFGGPSCPCSFRFAAFRAATFQTLRLFVPFQAFRATPQASGRKKGKLAVTGYCSLRDGSPFGFRRKLPRHRLHFVCPALHKSPIHLFE